MRLILSISSSVNLKGWLLEASRLLVSLILVVPMTACDEAYHESPVEKNSSTHKQVSTQYRKNELLDVASNIVLTSQQYEELEYRLSAKSIVVKPRSFGGFNILDINELYVYNSHIEVFPSDGAKNAPQSERGLTGNFSDLLKRYADSISTTYGHVSRLHMEDVLITMVGAGAEGSDIIITAEKLTKDFRNEKSPRIYNVSFSEKNSSKELLVSQAIWNVDERQFVLK